MLFNYKVIDKDGNKSQGSIDAVSVDVAISSLQRRNFVISSINPAEGGKSFFKRDISFLTRISNKDVVVLSRQMATLFEAQVSALRVFRLLSTEVENKLLASALAEIADDLQAGSSISAALAKHPKAFSTFYVNMVRSGEESGKLDETLTFLADYLDRTYAVNTKARNALIYPAFVIFTFITVLILMLTLVIPQIATIITESGSGAPIPIYTEFVIWLSNFFVTYGWLLLAILVVGGFFAIRFFRTETGKRSLDNFKITTPFVKSLYQKLYLSRISDNMNTMLISGIPMVRALELTADVVGNAVYHDILLEAMEAVKAGRSMSDAFDNHRKEIPSIMIQMIKVGEESGELGKILKTLSLFYSREVINAVDTLVDLIEPAMIIVLGLGVGFLMASVLVPIYNLSSSIS